MIPVSKNNLNLSFNFINSTLLHKILIGICCFIITLIIIINGALPEKFDLKTDDVSPIDFIAPRDIVDKYTTDKYKADEENKVPLQYDIVKTTTARCQQKVSEFMYLASEIRNIADISVEEKTKELKSQAMLKLSDESLLTIIKMKDNELSQLQVSIQNTIGQVMDKGVEVDLIGEALTHARQILEKNETSQQLIELSYQIIEVVIEPNKVLNEEETALLKEKARNSVDTRIYKKGEKIVGKGERLKPEHIAMLNELGLVRGKQGSDYRVFVGSVLAVALLYAILILYLYYFNKKILDDRSDLILLSLIMLSTLLLTMLIAPQLNAEKDLSLYLLPMAVAPMLITVLLDTKLAMITSFVLSILVGILAKGDTSFIFVSLISGFCASLTTHKAQQRNKLMLSGIIIGAINALLIISFGFINNNETNTVLVHGLHGMTNGVLSIIITIGLLPFLEATFDIITPLKLLELSNPNQPLIKRLLMEAPGTYHHSLMVGNLAEAATEAIGGNALLARVAAYYHDIGKLKRPYFFKENQFNDNPHDRMTANLSTLVITSHTKDGEEIAKSNNLPLAIRNIIKEHHGTTLVAYFYHKASKEGSVQLVDPEDFRYDGPKPQTKESAVVMLADCVEAVVRAIPDRTEGKVEGTVRKIIKEKLEDGQLDMCDLTLKDLDTIAKAFLRVFSGFFHERIQYPDIKLNEDIVVIKPEERAERGMEDENSRADHREQSTANNS